MRSKWHVSITLAVAIMMLFVSSVTAAPASTNVAQSSQDEIPDGVKSLSDLLDHLQSKGTVKNFDDLRNYMINNKQVIFKLSPNVVDYGFTSRLYVETDPLRDDGRIKLTHNHGVKEVQVWVVPFSITNTSKQTVEISNESLALVPQNIPAGKELEVLAIDPEYLMDSKKGNILGNFELPPDTEVRLNAVFYVFPMTSDKSVNLRVFDGKDHADVNIAKP
ncbi:hypothetical protein [Brevibacillus borstelensis]|uniref:hypothetical protein n=1 Tax=Brevibacillus borstelensis TaxID=45462 RepID=UPI00287FDEF2|nr:hypothetical protein [Brevibacillus borstelensis]WNF07274.1 hypothetical protein RFB14_07550 [Brevibacillus borstelensis]